MIQVLELVGGWLVIYSPVVGWVSAVTLPADLTASVWMVPE